MVSHARDGGMHVHHHLDFLTWPVLTGSIAVWPIWPWATALWAWAPTPTAVYMMISAGFMLFQMSDKLGLLERFKKRQLDDAPDDPPQEHKR